MLQQQHQTPSETPLSSAAFLPQSEASRQKDSKPTQEAQATPASLQAELASAQLAACAYKHFVVQLLAAQIPEQSQYSTQVFLLEEGAQELVLYQ